MNSGPSAAIEMVSGIEKSVTLPKGCWVAAICAEKRRAPVGKYARATTNALLGYSWPGNIRELRNVVELVCLMREGRSVRVPDLPAALRREVDRSASRTAEVPSGNVISVHLDRPLDETVNIILAAALALEDGNRSRAARRLGVSLRTMQRFAARGARSVRTSGRR